MPKYTLKVLTDFASAHTLRDYPGNCSRLHGHNWKVEAEVEATVLDPLGMAVDFKTIKSLAREIAGELDHTYLNDLAPFRDVNPTAENIAAWFFREMAARLNAPGVRVSAITLWETERACVRYTEA
ncbi:6-carboxytetrahydropterin synthase QueD [Ectothiorhodospira lacustris]|uniref:6-carboxytetrahydropterin synthase QueD n=1 Tax=Ectothiorhodospira lacustris TaxID=2899127 RepID=UPI001EE90845|nr:6-carboxytetrahydropterin synthase QueD [Ectothiorhodospira lacustris]MCG5511280.1 6-carboxytetrahydropterin synthase QueD [Ectothiorhodospira lacustris]MCG5523008.1 6-carboxytetrahydropterin synthase QueD [Ectothiorhodospira lacustris]